jgi:YVTN family beta-propeller protein
MSTGAALRAFLAAAALLGAVAGEARGQVPDPHRYTLFESGPVRPLALSPDGSTLFACNVPDARLEIFAVSAEGLRHTGSVPVGLEPVAVAARTNGEVWVVNHLSDSVSIVDVAARRVVRTLLVGDEPRDIVFAGPGGNRAFITAAHRGQNLVTVTADGVQSRPGDPQLLTPGIGRSDVWVFDATNLGAALGGTPVTVLNLFGDTPRALAVAPGGGTVYAAVFHSGNKTTAVTAGVLPTPPPSFTINTTDPATLQPLAVPTPAVAVMLKHESGNTWRDVTGAARTNLVRFQLPDYDVFALDANATPPVETGSFASVGTILFNMAVNPVSGAVYVSNTDANNMDRFEGFGTPNLRGELHKARVSILSAGGTVTPRHLNPHIDYAAVSPPQSMNDRSLGLPTALAVSGNGATLYLAAFGSGKLAFLPTAHFGLFAGAGLLLQARRIRDGKEAIFRVGPEFVAGVEL